MKNIWYYDYPIGEIGIVDEEGFICGILFDRIKKFEECRYVQTPLILKASLQIHEYFEGNRTVFNLPLSFQGTIFQKSVWKALQTIKAGQTKSYKDIAVQIGSPKASKAVGMANNRNPIPIIIPCHRVIGSDGSLVGYAGGLEMKKYLLDFERLYYNKQNIIF